MAAVAPISSGDMLLALFVGGKEIHGEQPEEVKRFARYIATPDDKKLLIDKQEVGK